jgi:hypothetical protein
LFPHVRKRYIADIVGDTSPNLAYSEKMDPWKTHANFTVLDTMKEMKTGPGGIICLYDNLLALDDRHHIIPVAYL